MILLPSLNHCEPSTGCVATSTNGRNSYFQYSGLTNRRLEILLTAVPKGIFRFVALAAVLFFIFFYVALSSSSGYFSYFIAYCYFLSFVFCFRHAAFRLPVTERTLRCFREFQSRIPPLAKCSTRSRSILFSWCKSAADLTGLPSSSCLMLDVGM
ncbi:hypothetical protein BJ742DRAFT_121927 [Cladochytrium replicatum]|nr:hypothetical protein BJ742DRAFT_121927 [Cladochytrium replicatum]